MTFLQTFAAIIYQVTGLAFKAFQCRGLRLGLVFKLSLVEAHGMLYRRPTVMLSLGYVELGCAMDCLQWSTGIPAARVNADDRHPTVWFLGCFQDRGKETWAEAKWKLSEEEVKGA
jgi:hypothetical protein